MVSVGEKARRKIVSGKDQRDERKRTIDEVSKIQGRRQNWWLSVRQDKFRGYLLTAWAASGIKVA